MLLLYLCYRKVFNQLKSFARQTVLFVVVLVSENAMGLISSILGYESKPSRILILGLDGVGKTTLLYRLVTGDTVQTIKTIGFNVEQLKHNNVTLYLMDTRRGSKMAPLTRHYYAGTKGIIFVIDSTDSEHKEEAEYELRNLLQEAEFKNTPFLIYANKQDLPNAMSTSELAQQLKLNEWKTHRIYLQLSCATEGRGLHEGLDWLCSELTKH